MVAAIALLLPLSCNKDTFFDDDLASDQEITFRAEDGGNNLSMPVVTPYGSLPAAIPGAGIATSWSDDTYPTSADPEYYVWVQKDPANTWRASTYKAGGSIITDYVDWGDNLEVKAWGTNSVIRVEVALFEAIAENDYTHEGSDAGEPEDDSDDNLEKGYKMYHVYGNGVDEVWGTDKGAIDPNALPDPSVAPAWATVYGQNARLVIQKIDDDADAEVSGLSWTGTEWTGFELDGVPYEAKLGFSAEVNVKGRVIYGYNWQEKRPLGLYRITFYADGIEYDESSQVVLLSEVEEEVTTAEDEGGESPNVPGLGVIDHEKNITYLDVRITKENNGGGGNGKPDNPGGGGDKPDNPGKGGGKPDNPGNGGGNGPGGKNATTTDNVSTATSTNTGGYYSNRPAYNYKPKTNKSTNTTDKNTNSNGKYDTGTKGSKATPSFDNNQDKNDTGKGKTSKPKGRRG